MLNGISEFWRLLCGRPSTLRLAECSAEGRTFADLAEPDWTIPETSRTADPEPELLEAMPQIAGGSNGNGITERPRPWWWKNGGNGENGRRRRDLTADEIVNAVSVFEATRNRIADGTLLPPGQYAAVLQHFSPVSQAQLGLTLTVAAEAAVGEVPSPTTLLSNAFTMPQVGIGTTAIVDDASYFLPGMACFIQGLGYFEVRAVDPRTLFVFNTGAPGNASPGTVAPVGSRVNVAGMPGGIEGPPGPAGPPGDTPRTTLSSPFTVPAVGGNGTAFFTDWASFKARMWVTIDRTGAFFIATDPGPGGVLLFNYGSLGNMPPGETAIAGAAVVATGPQGPEQDPGLPEAPADIYPYGRQNRTWTRVVSMAGSLGTMTGPLIAPNGTPIANGLALGDVAFGFCRNGNAIQLTAGGGVALVQWDRTSGMYMAVPIDMLGFKLTGLPAPVADSDAATRKFVLDNAGGGGPLPDPLILDEFIANRAVRVPNGTGSTMPLTIGDNSTGFYRMTGTGNPIMLQVGYTPVMRFLANGIDAYHTLTMNNQRITGLGTPTLPTDAATKAITDALGTRLAALEQTAVATRTGTGATNYLVTATVWTWVDQANLAVTTTIPVGYAALVFATGSMNGGSSASAFIYVALAVDAPDTLCSGRIMSGGGGANSAFWVAMSVTGLVVGDGQSHTIGLVAKQAGSGNQRIANDDPEAAPKLGVVLISMAQVLPGAGQHPVFPPGLPEGIPDQRPVA